MYLKVETLADHNKFNQIWMECWLEKGYTLDPSYEECDRFIVLDSDKREIGTIEFKPYYPTIQNEINTVFPFHEKLELAAYSDSVIEIDKVAILKEFRGKNLERLLSLILGYTEFYKITRCVVLLERVFYKALKNVYKVPLSAVGEKFYYKGDYVIPTIVYPDGVYLNKDKYSWIHPVNGPFNNKLIFT